MNREASSPSGDAVFLVLISIILFLTLLPFSGYVAALAWIRDEWHLTHAASGWVFSSYLIGIAVSSAFLVPVTDRLPPARIMAIGVALAATAHLLFPWLGRGFWSGTLLRFVAGAGHAAAYLPGIQLVSERFAAGKRGAAVGFFVSAGYAGTTLSYVVMGQLIKYTSGWRTAYLLLATSAALGLLLCLLPLDRKPAGSMTRALPWADLSVLRDRALVLVIIAYALHSAELYLARLWIPQLLAAALAGNGGTDTEATSAATTLSGAMFMTGIAGAFVGGALSDRWGRSGGAALIFSLSGACAFALGWTRGSPLIALGFAYGFLTAADSAIYLTAVTELAPARQRGSAQALQSLAGFGLGALSPIVAGAILDTATSPSAWGLAFSFNGALAVAGVIALLMLRRLPEAARMTAAKR